MRPYVPPGTEKEGEVHGYIVSCSCNAALVSVFLCEKQQQQQQLSQFSSCKPLMIQLEF